jgi:hypothetical protein
MILKNQSIPKKINFKLKNLIFFFQYEKILIYIYNKIGKKERTRWVKAKQ